MFLLLVYQTSLSTPSYLRRAVITFSVLFSERLPLLLLQMFAEFLCPRSQMLTPSSALCVREALRIGAELYHTLKGVIQEKYGQDAINVGDEGGFAPNILENSEGGCVYF